MPTIQLPDGHSAEIRAPTDVRRGDSRAVAAAGDKDLMVSGSSDGKQLQAAGAMLGTATMQDAVVFRFLKSWTLTVKDADPDSDDEGPAPITLEVVQNLPLKFYNPIAAPLLPALQKIMGAGQEMNGDPDPLSVARLSPSASTD
jgi:hypothetical protein